MFVVWRSPELPAIDYSTFALPASESLHVPNDFFLAGHRGEQQFHEMRAASLALLLVVPALAEGQASIDAKTASKMIDGCVAHSTAKKQSHAIAVYDAGGQPVALLRMDGNTPGVTEFAMQKAAAAAHWRFSTAQMEASAKTTPGFANAPRVVTVPGGVPVYSADGTIFLGAVGVSGEAPQDDAACAEAAVKAAGLSVSRRR